MKVNNINNKEADHVPPKDITLEISTTFSQNLEEIKGWAQMIKVDATIDEKEIEDHIKQQQVNKNAEKRFKDAKILYCLQIR